MLCVHLQTRRGFFEIVTLGNIFRLIVFLMFIAHLQTGCEFVADGVVNLAQLVLLFVFIDGNVGGAVTFGQYIPAYLHTRGIKVNVQVLFTDDEYFRCLLIVSFVKGRDMLGEGVLLFELWHIFGGCANGSSGEGGSRCHPVSAST